MDGIASKEKEGVVVLAATNRPNALDPALRRPGRFDREIEIGIPKEKDRREILSKLLSRVPDCCVSEEEISNIANVTHGYVGADLLSLIREAALLALCSEQGAKNEDSKQEVETTVSSQRNQAARSGDVLREMHLRLALDIVKPSAMREVLLEVPTVRWDDIGGQADIKQKLKEAVEWPLTHPEAFLRMGIEPPKGVLLYGPPGCSKTLMAKALATESSRNFLAVKGPELFSKYLGDSEKAIREIFRKARAASPSIIFFDEIDSIASKRGGDDGSGGVSDRVLSQLLVEMDGVEPLQQVTVVAATNRPDLLDPALLRPGRIDRILYVGPPDKPATKEIFTIELKKMAHASDVQADRLAEQISGLSGAELVALCREAALQAMEEDRECQEVQMKHFDAVISRSTSRITSEMIEFYESYARTSGLTVL